MIRQLLIDCRRLITGRAGRGNAEAIEVQARIDTALAEQSTAEDDTPSQSRLKRVASLTAAQEGPVATVGVCKVLEWIDGVDFVAIPIGTKLYTHPPHPQVNEPPSSLTSGQGKELAQKLRALIRYSPNPSTNVNDPQMLNGYGSYVRVEEVMAVADQLAGETK